MGWVSGTVLMGGRTLACHEPKGMTQGAHEQADRFFIPALLTPVTNGHLDVIERACKIVDVLFVGIGVNSTKAPAADR